MADKKLLLDESKIDALYSWIAYDLQKMKGDLVKELKISSMQVGSFHQDVKSSNDKTTAALAQEIRYGYKQNQTIYDGLATMLTDEVAKRLETVDEKVSVLSQIESAVADVMNSVAHLENVDVEALSESIKTKVAEMLPQLDEAVCEIKYSFMQQQAIYDGLSTLISGEVITKLGEVENKLALLEQIDSTLVELSDLKSTLETMAEKAEESLADHSRQILEAVAAIPVAENVDYNRIVDEVGDKVLDLLNEVVNPEPAEKEPVEAKIDYDKIVYGTAEKVIESLPYPEKVDYRRIEDGFAKAASAVQVTVDADMLASVVSAAVEKAIAALDLDALAAAVAEKIDIPVVEPVEPEAIDYDRLSDMVAAKLSAVADQTYDVVLDETGINEIAEKVSEKLGAVENVDYDKISAIVDEKLANANTCDDELTYNLVVDEEGVQAIATKVADELCQMCATCEAPVAEEVVEEPVAEEEPVVEEIVEETVEEPVVEEVAETVEEVVEEPVAEAPVVEELAVAEDLVYQEVDNELVDAETGLVIRLKRSFTAKMKQSDERIKGYYSDIKNELTSYKRINSNVSWHGDRFNFGRDTVAKANICGKTLCFYLALDPENPEFKQTIYHQKNVGNQKAYESTPFMIKVKSDAAAKKVLRLVGYLAEKLGTEKENNFEAVDYVEEFAYESTKQLFEDGYIKVTKEKKVELNF